MRLYDISQPINSAIATWPGDQPYRLEWTLRQDRGDSVNVAALTMSVHTGTHVDAGLHIGTDGQRAGALPLEPFIGAAVVVDAVGLDPLDERVLERFDVSQTPRVLLRTRERASATEFPLDFQHPTAALARRLVSAGVKLVGTDAPSVDAHDSRTLDTHRILIQGGIAILENLALTGVQAGRYTLVALPLKLMEADGSPVRAILIDGSLS
ncbi:MAG: arylformamidase [Longimicrobiales bacterium]